MGITYGKVTPSSYSDPEVIALDRCLKRFGQAVLPGAYLVDTYPILQYVPGYLTQLKEWHQEELALFEGQMNTVWKQMVTTYEHHGLRDLYFSKQAEGTAQPCFAKFLIENQREHQIEDKGMAYVAGAMFGAGSETVSSKTENITFCMRYPELMCTLMYADCLRDYDHDDGCCVTPGGSSNSAGGIR